MAHGPGLVAAAWALALAAAAGAAPGDGGHAPGPGRAPPAAAPRALARTVGTADHPLLVGDGRRAWLSWLTRDESYRLLPLDGAG